MRVQPVLGLAGILENRHAYTSGIDEHREEPAEGIVPVVSDDECRTAAERGAEADELEGNLLELSDRREEIHLADVDQAAALFVGNVGGDGANHANGFRERHFP